MNKRTAKILRGLAEHIRVKIKYIGGMPDGFFGFADPRSRIIAINANKPHDEHVFTILHELAHFLLHFDQPYRLLAPRWVDRPYKSTFMVENTYKLKRMLRRRFGREWQADLWALMAFPMVGTPDELGTFFSRHPRKMPLFFLGAAFHAKARFGKFIRKLFHK
jgi:hypothetical protein